MNKSAKSTPPSTKRRFGHDWKEVEYVLDKLMHWFRVRRDRQRARHFAGRLRRLLERVGDEADVALLGSMGRALLCEIDGDLAGAVGHYGRIMRAVQDCLARDPDTPRGPSPS